MLRSRSLNLRTAIDSVSAKPAAYFSAPFAFWWNLSSFTTTSWLYGIACSLPARAALRSLPASLKISGSAMFHPRSRLNCNQSRVDFSMRPTVFPLRLSSRR